MSFSQQGRAPIIQRYTILVTNTWEQAFTGVNGVRKWMLKLDEASQNTFRYRFKSSGDHMTNSGVGISMDGCDLPDIYVYGTSGDVAELLYWA